MTEVNYSHDRGNKSPPGTYFPGPSCHPVTPVFMDPFDSLSFWLFLVEILADIIMFEPAFRIF